MKILLAVHHPLDPRLGASGASLTIGHEMRKRGHEVHFYGYDDAFGHVRRTPSILRMLFPWRLATFLARRSALFDVLDITTGDGYIWAALSRQRGKRPLLVTRSNGLEHLAHEALLRQARAGNAKLSWRYPIYNGGLRLWEVRQSVRLADGVVVLNERERRFALEHLGASEHKTRVISHGLDDTLLALNPPHPPEGSSQRDLRLAFIGHWISSKGSDLTAKTVEVLRQRGRNVRLTVLGAGQAPEAVLARFSVATRTSVRVISRYQRENLPELLRESDVMIFPSRFEGFGLAIIEAMACGVVPICTRVGIAEDVIEPGKNGFLVDHDDAEQIANMVETIYSDLGRLNAMRLAAHATVRRYSWSRTAEQTLELYDSLRRADAGSG